MTCRATRLSLSWACRAVPICRVLPHSAALAIRRISLTVMGIGVYAHPRSRSHNTEVSARKVCCDKHLQMTSVLPNTEVAQSPPTAGRLRGTRAEPTRPGKPRHAPPHALPPEVAGAQRLAHARPPILSPGGRGRPFFSGPIRRTAPLRAQTRPQSVGDSGSSSGATSLASRLHVLCSCDWAHSRCAPQ